MRKANGCMGPAPGPVWIDIKGRPHFQCPNREVAPEVEELFAMYQAYKRGHLPARGAISDQSSTLWAGFTYIDKMTAEHKKPD